MTDLAAALDLGDVSRCPVGKRCHCCGRLDDDGMADDEAMAVVTFTTLLGTVCMTSCPACVRHKPDRLDLATNMFSAILHAGHCGVGFEFGSPGR